MSSHFFQNKKFKRPHKQEGESATDSRRASSRPTTQDQHVPPCLKAPHSIYGTKKVRVTNKRDTSSSHVGTCVCACVCVCVCVCVCMYIIYIYAYIWKFISQDKYYF